MGFVNTPQMALAAFSLAVIGLLFWKGGAAERLSGAAFMVLMFGSPAVDTEFRLGMVLLSLAALVWLAWLSLAHDRWWLVLAVAFQGLVVATHLSAILEPDARLWSLVTVRLFLWTALMMLAVIGLLEARWAPYARTTSKQASVRPN